MKLFILSFILSFLNAEPKLEGKWKMHRNEAFENILTSNNFRMQDEQQQKALAETFNKVLNGYYYDFRKDTVYFTDYKNYEIIELKGIWWTDADTVIIGQVNKISVQKYLISKITEKELHLKIIDQRSGAPSDTRLMFKRQ